MSPIEKLRRDLLRLLGLSIGLVLAVLATRAYLSEYLPQFPTRPFAVAVLCACLLRATLWKGRGKAALGVNPPRVKGWLPGNIDILWKLVQGESSEYCAATLREWEHEYGSTYDMNVLWGHQIVTSDPTNVKEMLATKFTQFEKSVRFRDMLVNFLGDAIFTSDGEQWKKHRAIARPFFAHDRTSDYELFEKHSKQLVECIVNGSQNGESLDIQSLFARFTIDSIAEFLLGVHLNTLDGKWSDTKDNFTDFVRAFEELQSISMTRVRIGSNWPIFELFRDKSQAPAQVLTRFVEPIVRKAFNERDSREPISPQKKDLDQTYLQYLVDQGSDPKSVRDSVVSLLLAGRDTTASLLSFATYCLAIHPEATELIRKEIDTVLSSSTRSPTAEDIKSMRYLRAFLNETLRLFPSVPLNIRRAVENTTLSSPLSHGGPFIIRKNVSVTYAPILTQRRLDLWGADAEEFKPERWLASAPLPQSSSEEQPINAHLKNLTHVSNPYAFTPFNAGPRICLGQSFALSECAYTIIRLLQTFDGFEIDSSRQKLPHVNPSSRSQGRASVEKCWPRASLTLYIEGGLWIKPHMAPPTTDI